MKLFKLRQWPDIIVLALTFTFGMQIVRTLPPYLQYLLGDRLHWSPGQLGLVGVLIFSTGFLCSWLISRFGLRRLFTVSTGGLGVIRLAMQLWTGDPLVDMGLTVAGTILLILFLPAALLYYQQHDRGDLSQALLLGLIFDAVLLGVFRTYDFIWQRGYIPLLLSVGLVWLQWTALRVSVRAKPLSSPAVGPTFLRTLPWLAIGPFLFLQLLVFQNQARLAALTGWSLPTVFSWVLLAHLLGLTVVIHWQPHRTGTAILGLILAVALWPFAGTSWLVPPLALLAGQISAAVLLATIVRGLAGSPVQKDSPGEVEPRSENRYGNVVWAHGIGMLLAVSLIFGYYITFSLSLPYRNDWLVLFAGLVVGVGGVGAAQNAPLPDSRKIASAYAPLMLSWILMLLPLLLWLTWVAPVSTSGNPSAGRVMTYNVHNGFSTAGQLDLEALAQVIEIQQADIVALQEVSRGWVINGSVEMFNWLSHRLQTPYTYFIPSSDPLWGQAVLSRYPIVLATSHPLPPRTLPMPRSFGYLEIEVGQQVEPLRLLNAHLHHVDQDGSVRMVQIETILNFLDSQDLAQNIVLAGDLNATPDSPEIQRLYNWGFQDVVAEAGLTPDDTFPATQPYKRLDYLLFTPGLAATNVLIPRSTASDHLGIAASIPKP